MHLFVTLTLPVFLIFQAQALPNVFEYEIERAKDFVHSFEENSQKDQKSFTAQDQRRVKLGKFSWKDCSSSAPIASLKSLTILPDPLVFPGPLNVQTEFTLKKDIVAPLKADLKVRKEEFGVYIEIPCIDNIGSCTYDDVCELLSQVKDQCPDPVKKTGIDCSCPIKQKSYSLPKTEFDISAAIIPTGSYHITANLTQGGAEAGCLDIYLSID